jgi:hypothetical protein
MKLLISTGASARWRKAVSVEELFQQFLAPPAKPLKWLKLLYIALHRAEAPVLIRMFNSA